MQILVHIGLNKCASTYIQLALRAAQTGLQRHGVFYSVEGSRPAQYGLSQYYGFGPDAADLIPRSIGWVVDQANERGCGKVIISSEYLSLFRPAAIARFTEDLNKVAGITQFQVFSRDLAPWVQSLFNQYVKTVDGGRYFHTINEYVDQVFANDAINIAQRLTAWLNAVGGGRIAHHHINRGQPADRVLEPFRHFAGLPIAAVPQQGNRSLSTGALYLTGLIRQAPQTTERNQLLAQIAASDCAWVPAPPGYLEIDGARMTRLETEILAPFQALPWHKLRATTAA